MDQKEQNLQRALTDFEAGEFEFVSEAAFAYGVPPLNFNG